MECFATGSEWAFDNDVPGSWTDSWTQEDVDAQIHAEYAKHHARYASSAPSENEAQHEHADGEESSTHTHYPPRTCRICLEQVLPAFHPEEGSLPLPDSLKSVPRVTYESPPGDGGRLIRPCKCKGSQKYVHEECLGAWRRQDPSQKRNYWECPTCGYRYHLQRLTWGIWIRSTAAQIGLTFAIFILAMFVCGFFADPLLKFYLDPVDTVVSAGGPRGSLIFEDEPAGWAEHFIKGLASLGLLGFAKFALTLSPWHWFNMRGTGIVVGGRSGVGNTGRDRLHNLSWFAISVGIVTFLWAVYKGVRAWSRRTLEMAGERVMDVPFADDDEDDNDD